MYHRVYVAAANVYPNHPISLVLSRDGADKEIASIWTGRRYHTYCPLVSIGSVSQLKAHIPEESLVRSSYSTSKWTFMPENSGHVRPGRLTSLVLDTNILAFHSVSEHAPLRSLLSILPGPATFAGYNVRVVVPEQVWIELDAFIPKSGLPFSARMDPEHCRIVKRIVDEHLKETPSRLLGIAAVSPCRPLRRLGLEVAGLPTRRASADAEIRVALIREERTHGSKGVMLSGDGGMVSACWHLGKPALFSGAWSQLPAVSQDLVVFLVQVASASNCAFAVS